MKLNKFDLIAIGMAVLVPAAAYFGLFKFRVSRLRQLSSEAAELDARTTEDQNISVKVALARKHLRTFKQHISEFMESIPVEDQAHEAVGAIVSDAKQAGIQIEAIKPGDPVEGKTLNYLPISLVASADFSKLYDFLVRIESNKTVLTVSRMEIESKPAAKRCAIQLELRIYFVKSKDRNGEGAPA